jgi:hypothetical protein
MIVLDQGLAKFMLMGLSSETQPQSSRLRSLQKILAMVDLEYFAVSGVAPWGHGPFHALKVPLSQNIPKFRFDGSSPTVRSKTICLEYRLLCLCTLVGCYPHTQHRSSAPLPFPWAGHRKRRKTQQKAQMCD